MDEYIDILILNYINSRKESYSFLQLAKLLGLTNDALSGYIENLIKNDQLAYINNLLSPTINGLKKLKQVPLDYVDCEAMNFNSEFQTSEPWPLEKIYVPENFLD